MMICVIIILPFCCTNKKVISALQLLKLCKVSERYATVMNRRCKSSGKSSRLTNLILLILSPLKLRQPEFHPHPLTLVDLCRQPLNRLAVVVFSNFDMLLHLNAAYSCVTIICLGPPVKGKYCDYLLHERIFAVVLRCVCVCVLTVQDELQDSQTSSNLLSPLLFILLFTKSVHKFLIFIQSKVNSMTSH